MAKKAKSAQEQAISLARVKSAVTLSSFHPKVEPNKTTYDRNTRKREDSEMKKEME